MKEYHQESMQQLLKGSDVAQILNISRSQAYRLMQQGVIPTVRIGRSVRVRRENLAEYITQNTFSQTPQN